MTTHVHSVATWTQSIGTSHWWTSPAWIQAILSGLAILVSGVLAVAVPAIQRHMEMIAKRRLDLQLSVFKAGTGSMQLEVNYLTTSSFYACDCIVEVLRPTCGIAVEGDGPFTAARKRRSRMARTNTGVGRCFWLFGNLDATDLSTAKIKVSVVTAHQSDLIVSRTEWVSTINSTPEEERLLNARI